MGVVSNGSGGFQLDFDPNDDPELALALRVSMEENRARLAQDEKSANDANELQPKMSVLESLPGVDPQSEAMRQAMGALTGSAKKEDKDDKKSDDKDKK